MATEEKKVARKAIATKASAKKSSQKQIANTKKIKTTGIDSELNLLYLLAIYLVCADEQIHMEELRRMTDLDDGLEIGESTLREAEKIFNQAPDRLSVENLAQRLPKNERDEAFNQLLVLAYTDGFCDPLEKGFLEQLAVLWKINPENVEKRILEVERYSLIGDIDEQDTPADLPLGARILRRFDSLLSKKVIDRLRKVAPSRVNQRIDELRQTILLAGPEYDMAISKCEEVADGDIVCAGNILNTTKQQLFDLIQLFATSLDTLEKSAGKGTAASAKEVIAQLRDDCERLEQKLYTHIHNIHDSLERKKRATRFFTISFIGKTKVGKSTLHATVTGEGWDSIGAGAQRTTRYNRVYEWKNMRVIDTPGIGAPGGKSDEEIAKSIIDESDVICFVVTNNNQQESEFQFLRILKERAKPLVILLNIQENLSNDIRLRRFLENPNKLFSEDKLYVGGHIDRIRKYAEESYGNSYFDIIPVQLLAAQMARDGSHPECSDMLYRHSRIQQFMNTLRIALIDYGVIRRSQTLLGCTLADIQEPLTWAKNTQDIYTRIADTLASSKDTALKKIKSAGDDALEEMTVTSHKIFDELKTSVTGFAEDHWNCKEKELNQSWSTHIKKMRIKQRLEMTGKSIVGKFGKEVEEVLEEIGRDLSLISGLQVAEDHIDSQDSSTIAKNILRWGGNILMAVGTIAAFTLVGWVPAAIGIFGVVLRFLSGFLTDKATKRRNAVETISKSLISSIEEQKKQAVDNAKSNLSNQIEAVISSVTQYFDTLVKGLASISENLQLTHNELSKQVESINLAYGERVLAWIENNGNSDKAKYLGKNGIVSVERDIGKTMTIYTNRPVVPKITRDVIRRVLQEDVTVVEKNT